MWFLKDKCEYKETNEFKKRLDFATKQLSKKRIPVIVYTTGDIELKKTKYLTKREMLFGGLMILIRKMIKGLNEREALFFFVKGSLIPATLTIGQIWDRFKDGDEHLYIQVQREETFGHCESIFNCCKSI